MKTFEVRIRFLDRFYESVLELSRNQYIIWTHAYLHHKRIIGMHIQDTRDLTHLPAIEKSSPPEPFHGHFQVAAWVDDSWVLA